MLPCPPPPFPPGSAHLCLRGRGETCLLQLRPRGPGLAPGLRGRGRLRRFWSFWGLGRAGKLPGGAGVTGNLLNLRGLFGLVAVSWGYSLSCCARASHCCSFSWCRAQALGCRLQELYLRVFGGFPGGLDGKESACNAGDLCSIPGSERSPGEGNVNPLLCSCWENPMERGAWQGTVHGVTLNPGEFGGCCLLPQQT